MFGFPGIQAYRPRFSGSVIACGLETGYSGGEAFPSEFNVTLGAGLGGVLLEYVTSFRPDKIEVWLGGVKVLDTGYVGDTSYQSELNAALSGMGLPPEDIRQRIGTGDVGDDWADIKTREYAAFIKTTTNPVATVRVYAPLSGTAWRMKLHCPDGYAYQVFSDSDDFVVPSGVTEVDAFLVAGGGAGLNKPAGNFVGTPGAGAGGVLEVIGHSVTPLSSMPIVIGEGGVSGSPGTRGGDTTFDGQVAVGGGAAGYGTHTSNMDGGSGGGALWNTTPGDGVPGSGVDGQGHDGGKITGSANGHKSGGGGGSKTPGSNGSIAASGGAGGDGHSLAERGWGPAIALGAPVAVGGGGGGGRYRNTSGTSAGGKGGYGGGGDGGGASSSAVQNGSNGVDGTGGGGGGAGGNSQTSGNESFGGPGGKGIAIIRWKIS